ncbi:MAG: D-2-hydroxyacid dehydrogenase [Halioglobus sp.]
MKSTLSVFSAKAATRATKTAALFLGITVLAAAPTFAAKSQPTAEAAALIETLGLRAAKKPMAKHPQWKPKRVIAMMIPAMGIDSPDYEKALRKAAGDVELVIDRSGGFIPSAELLEGADAVIGICAAPTLKQAGPQLRWIHHYFVGMDYCTGYSDDQLRDMVFTNNKRLSGPAIAEHTIAMMLSLSRGLPAYHSAQTTNTWARKPGSYMNFGELSGKTMLVVGLGGIGTQIALRAHGLGMKVIATRNSSRSGPDYVEYVGLADELTTLAAKADVIVNALPLTADTTNLFDKAFFEKTKKGAMFLSVGRGKSTITADLIAALESGQLFGAGLDVTDPEPLPKESPLWQMENVIITPHISAAGFDSAKRSMIIAAENLRRYVAGEAMLNVVDLERGY